MRHRLQRDHGTTSKARCAYPAAALTNEFTGVGGNGIFSFDELVIEDGTLNPGRLVGSGQIIKRSIGEGRIVGSDVGTTYNGTIRVEEGAFPSPF